MTEFKTSSFCNYGDCVEVALSASGSALMRDSKDSGGPTLAFDVDEWRCFTDEIKSGTGYEEQ